MADRFLPYGRQTVDEADIAAVVDVLRGDWLTTGPNIDRFEAVFAEAVGVPHAVACSSGTAALHLAALALGLGPGDWTVVPSVTFLATANAARYVGAEVSFADIDPNTGLTNASLMQEAAARAGGPVKALFPVHLAGHSVDLVDLRTSIPEVLIVEDACHALGGRYLGADGEMINVGSGGLSDIAAFSTHPVKTIATAEGGVLTTENADTAEKLRMYRNHGMTRDPSKFQNHDMAFDPKTGEANPWYYEMPDAGFNYRLSDLHAALGVSQMSKLGEFSTTRRSLRDVYAEKIPALGPHVQMTEVAAKSEPTWHLAVVLIDFPALGLTRAEVMSALRAKGIGSQVHYVPVHHQPYYRERYGALSLPGVDQYYAQCLSLPLYASMVEDDVDRVVSALGEVLKIK